MPKPRLQKLRYVRESFCAGGPSSWVCTVCAKTFSDILYKTFYLMCSCWDVFVEDNASGIEKWENFCGGMPRESSYNNVRPF